MTSVESSISLQEASKASPVNLSPVIVNLNHVLRRRGMENVLSAEAVVTGKVVSIFVAEVEYWGKCLYTVLRPQERCWPILCPFNISSATIRILVQLLMYLQVV